MERTITVDLDKLVELMQTFYAQGIDDAAHTPVALYEDITKDIVFQLDLLVKREAERDLIEWEKREGLWRDTLPDNL